jgi:hypothetical protein
MAPGFDIPPAASGGTDGDEERVFLAAIGFSASTRNNGASCQHRQP